MAQCDGTTRRRLVLILMVMPRTAGRVGRSFAAREIQVRVRGLYTTEAQRQNAQYGENSNHHD